MYAIKKIYIYPTSVSKNKWKESFLLIIPNGNQHWHYLAVKTLSALLRGITSKYHGYFYFLNCFHLFQQKRNFSHIKTYVEIKISVIL